MSSEDLKEALDEWLEESLEDNEENLEKALGKWKRLSKKKNKEGQDVRIFENKFLNKKVMTVDDEILGFLADGNYVFHLQLNEDDTVWAAVSDYKYFKTDGCQSDWHLAYVVAFPAFMHEEMEGAFSSDEDEQTTRQALLDLGFVEDQAYSSFIESCS